MNAKWMKVTFAASAIYDGIVGLLFLLLGTAIYDYFGIERPNHLGYLQFPALLIIVFAIMYWRIASDPAKFRDLIPYGIGLKLSYCLVVFYHWTAGAIPVMWVPFAWLDVIFLVLFFQTWRKVGTVNRSAT